MIKQHLPFGIRTTNSKYSYCISKDEYRELTSYANEKKVKLEGFKQFSGEISIIKEMIDDIILIALDFPALLVGKKSITLVWDENSPENDFATTLHHRILINSKVFSDKKYLEKEYNLTAEEGKFVKGTSYRSVIRHEVGHVVANMYGLNTMDIARRILPNKSDFEITEYVHDNVSFYAADYEEGREFISESFSAYYSNIDIFFAKEYVNICKEFVKEDSKNDKK